MTAANTPSPTRVFIQQRSDNVSPDFEMVDDADFFSQQFVRQENGRAGRERRGVNSQRYIFDDDKDGISDDMGNVPANKIIEKRHIIDDFLGREGSYESEIEQRLRDLRREEEFLEDELYHHGRGRFGGGFGRGFDDYLPRF